MISPPVWTSHSRDCPRGSWGHMGCVRNHTQHSPVPVVVHGLQVVNGHLTIHHCKKARMVQERGQARGSVRAGVPALTPGWQPACVILQSATLVVARTQTACRTMLQLWAQPEQQQTPVLPTQHEHHANPHRPPASLPHERHRPGPAAQRPPAACPAASNFASQVGRPAVGRQCRRLPAAW